MVDLSDPKSPVREGINNTIFIVPAIVVAILVGLFGYKLYSSLQARRLASEAKKKLKQQRKEKKKK